ncbi:PfkB family carbohydrate kinase [Rhizobium sp. AAP43]|uniref:PfkB family carbohydrate kinase n=1 Tax=Rhizobium sp. AAP43 TaxID=1523420 RepID=UPI0006B96BC7|nr:PfkB family carbohydrate kinase [Rhizobium sp. AAP43]KPF46135.1 carbohydrate kinase [Rhizobium sp. AAP43]
MIDGRAKAQVVVIGHVNHDRIWRLNETLRSGARIAWHSRETRLGGGGYFTGRRLLQLGHPVTLISNLMDDAAGDQAFADLAAEGFDTSLITRREGETDFADILLDPEGERTILSSERRLSRSFVLDEPVSAAAFYVNAPRLPEAAITSLSQARLSVSQLPLRDAGPRPADVVVGSKADLPEHSIKDIWQLAHALSGERLRHLVMTDGPAAMVIYDGAHERRVPVTEQVSVRDTIGAGDSFSGALIDGLLREMEIAEAARHASSLTARWLEQREQGADPIVAAESTS